MPSVQNLLIRNPSLTREEASDSFFRVHGPIAAVYFLSHGFTYYAQVHPKLTTKDPAVDVEKYDFIGEGCTEDYTKIFAPEGGPEPQWKKDYYTEVVLKDEKRLFVSPAMEHLLRVPAGTVEGERRVFIENGELKAEIPGHVWEVWRKYEARGAQEEKPQ